MTDGTKIAVLFDMDGVLVDTMSYHGDSFMRVGTKLGYTEAEIKAATQRSNSLKVLYAALQTYRPLALNFAQFVDATLEDLFSTIEGAGGLTPDPELLAFLQDIRAHGVEVAVGTSAVRKSAARKLAMVELHNEFDVIVTADDVERHKPNPDVYLTAAQKLGVDPHRCVVIDDALVGVQAGKAAGAKTIGFTKYLKDKSVLGEADLTANSFAELSYQRLRQLLNS